jgi:hypothetical protein
MTSFIGLGFQKCATTWLSIRLRRHSRLHVPPVNELRFWNHYEKGGGSVGLQGDYVRKWSRRLLEARNRDEMCGLIERLSFWKKYVLTPPDGAESYRSLFTPGEDHLAFGEISPSYVMLGQDTFSLIERSLAPKVFLIMREPIARLWSQIRHERRLRPENVATPESMVELLSTPRFLIQADYAAVICRLREVFPGDRIGCFFFEDMLAGEEEFLKSVCAFIGVPHEPSMEAPAERKKPSKSGGSGEKMPSNVMDKAMDLYGGQAEAVERLLGRVPEPWKKNR